MESLATMKDTLITAVQGQMANLQDTNTKELGEVIDMIKDLAEAIYYCKITEAMQDKENNNSKETYYYTEKIYPSDMNNQRYYNDGGGSSSYARGGNGRGNGSSRMYHEYYEPYSYEYPVAVDMHDMREGRSPMSRRNYMESKEMHQGKEVQIKELEKYVQELSRDITEMIEDASPEEKQMLQQKMAALATKIK